MFIQAVKVMYKGIRRWEEKNIKTEDSSDNPFIFDHQEVLDVANDYLKTYIEEEVQKIINDKQILIFTNRMDRPFIRECKQREDQLEELIAYIECMIGQEMNAYERAYMSYVFYNEVEDNILREVICITFFHSIALNKFRMYWFFKKIGMLLKEGQEILYTDLQEIYAAYDSKKIWKYHTKG